MIVTQTAPAPTPPQVEKQEGHLRAFKFALDLTSSQEVLLAKHAGAARWAYNHLLAAKQAAHREWRAQVDALVESGIPEAKARKQVKTPIPNKPVIHKAWVRARGDERTGEDGLSPWHHEINSYAFQSAWLDADGAWKNWVQSFRGARAGRRVGYPRFKKKGKSRDSFRLHHDAKRPSIRMASARRLRLPAIGEVRVEGRLGKRLMRLVGKGEAVVQSVTVSRGGSRWYASVLCKVTTPVQAKPTRRQITGGTVGVHLGVNPLASLSRPWQDGDIAHSVISNPRTLDRATTRLLKAQRALSRTAKGSNRRAKAARKVGRIHHLVALQRANVLHQMTRRLTRRFETIALYDLDVLGLTESPRRSKKQHAYSDLNRRILDAAPGEVRRQLTYKTRWYGSQLALLNREFHPSKTCSSCERQKPSLTLKDRTFHCDHCGLRLPRGVNAARNIAHHAVVTTETESPPPVGGPDGSVASRTGET